MADLVSVLMRKNRVRQWGTARFPCPRAMHAPGRVMSGFERPPQSIDLHPVSASREVCQKFFDCHFVNRLFRRHNCKAILFDYTAFGVGGRRRLDNDKRKSSVRILLNGIHLARPGRGKSHAFLTVCFRRHRLNNITLGAPGFNPFLAEVLLNLATFRSFGGLKGGAGIRFPCLWRRHGSIVGVVAAPLGSIWPYSTNTMRPYLFR